MRNVRLISAQVIAAGLGLASSANASTIVAPLGGTYTVSGSVSTPNPNNNNTNSTSQSTNTLNFVEDVTSITGNWGASWTWALGTGSTEYFVTKTIKNDSGATWGSFSLSTFNSGAATFDYDILPTISGLGTAGATYHQTSLTDFNFTGLSIANTDTVTLTFSLDTCSGCSGSWQIIQQAAVSNVPEPAPMLLSAGGILCIGLWQRRRFRKSRGI